MNIDFDKGDGLVPAIIQDDRTHAVLMLGYMNREAYNKTIADQRVTFYSRSRQTLWTKGETSGHFFDLVSIQEDCDQDALLIRVRPHGPACHTGSPTCFGKEYSGGFVYRLESIIESRLADGGAESYTRKLMDKGVHKVAQKVGEEAVELVIEALRQEDEFFANEAADLLFHYLILLKAKGFTFRDIERVLEERNKIRTSH